MSAGDLGARDVASGRLAVVTLASPDRFDRVREQHELLRLHHEREFADGRYVHVLAVLTPRRGGIRDSQRQRLPRGISTVDVPATPLGVHLSRGRNAAVALAAQLGATTLVFLDADCLPGAELLRCYVAAQRDGSISLGPVTYLTEAETRAPLAERVRYEHPHPERPFPEAGIVRDTAPAGDRATARAYNLFWSLSFACSVDDFRRIGGFCEQYAGYGGEDTDFSYAARSRGIGLRWVGGAHAVHQWHPVSAPPVEHLDAIVRNARIFFARWGVWPMRGWLDVFAARRLLIRDRRLGWRRP